MIPDSPFSRMVSMQLQGPLPQDRRTSGKRETTRAIIMRHAMAIARDDGIAGITFSALAERSKLSRSTVFSRCGSHQQLLVDILAALGEKFTSDLVVPCMGQARGLPRLRALLSAWSANLSDPGKPAALLMGAMMDPSGHGPSVRSELRDMALSWRAALCRCAQQAVAQGHLREGTDCEQLIFELYGAVLAVHHEACLWRAERVGADLAGVERALQPYLAA